MLHNVFYVLKHGMQNIAASIREMDYIHTLLVFVLLLFAFLAIISSLRAARKRQGTYLAGILSVFLTFSLFFLCVVASQSGTLIFLPSSQPEETVVRFLDAWCAGRMEEAQSCLSAPAQLWYGAPDAADPTDALYYEALTESYSYRLTSTPVLEGRHATQTLDLTSLSLSALPDDIASIVPGLLEDIVASRRSAEVVDAEDNYLPEVLDEVYRSAVTQTLADAADYYTVTEVTLELDYQGGVWRILPNDALALAFSGGISQIANYANNAKSEVLGDLVYVPKLYTLEEDVTVAPAPIESAYGDAEPAEIPALLAEHARLIDGRELFWDAEADFTDPQVHYYADDTILVLTWRELFLNHSVCFSEVFIADGSQFRRKLAADTYGSGIQKPASELARETNAVVAMNGDFYKFRTQGVTVYQRELYRFNPSTLDCCHVNSAGDLVFSYAGELSSQEQARQFIEDNDILFTLAFGPVLVADGEKRTLGGYLIGEVLQTYSRSAIGQRGQGHYLLMTSNYGFNTIGATIHEAADIMYAKGCENAYALDGGQTAEIVWRGVPYNNVDFGNERAVSDILYFATALPEGER